MSYNSKYKGVEIEELLDSIDNKVDKVEGKQLSTEDFTTSLKQKLEDLSNIEYATKEELQDVVENINPTPMISVTYSELVALRDNGELVAGMQYRITDFVTTTAQENTQSAGHQFDIIVTADNENTLNEVARACRSEFDIEKYKDAESSTIGVKMLYVGIYEYNENEYHLYESETYNWQMLVDFKDLIRDSIVEEHDYPYLYYPTFIRYKEDVSWGEWSNGNEVGETIDFKHNLAEDTYFNGSNLAAWQIWYSLDNDVSRFPWAKIPLYSPKTNSKMIIVNDETNCTYIYVRAPGYDENGKCGWLYASESLDKSFIEYVNADYEDLDVLDCIYTNSENLTIGDVLDMGGSDVTLFDISYVEGKGVIYRMVDERNNDLPYDFKNIMFKRYELNAPELYEASDNNDYWLQKLSENIRAMFNSNAWAFIWSGFYRQDKYWENDFEAVMSTPTGSSRFFYTFSDDSDIPNDCSLGDTCYNNVMLNSNRLPNNVFFGGGKQYNNRFGCNCCDNSISLDYNNNTFGGDCYGNCFGTYFSYNIFGNSCSYNSFGNSCQNNTFGNRFRYNSLGDNCIDNSFGNNSEYNGLGNYSLSNAFGNECSYNGFGRECQYNRLGNYCWNNSSGDKFTRNSFGESCSNNTFRDYSGMAHHVSQNTLENGVLHVDLYYDDTPETYTSLRYHHVYSGVNNCQIFLNEDRAYETCYACDRESEVHKFCIIDFKNS